MCFHLARNRLARIPSLMKQLVFAVVFCFFAHLHGLHGLIFGVFLQLGFVRLHRTNFEVPPLSTRDTSPDSRVFPSWTLQASSSFFPAGLIILDKFDGFRFSEFSVNADCQRPLARQAFFANYDQDLSPRGMKSARVL